MKPRRRQNAVTRDGTRLATDRVMTAQSKLPRTPSRAHRAEASSPDVFFSAPSSSERRSLLAWLDEGLRGGRAGRTEAEYPLALGKGRRVHQTVARVNGAFAAHALGTVVLARAAGIRIPVGLIGLVYTDPRWRGRSLASSCVERCAQELSWNGARIVALWSDLANLYEPLGFRPAGTEWIYTLDPTVCREAAGHEGVGLEVTPPTPADWPALESLYSAKLSRAERAPGALRELASVPDCTLVVARRNEMSVAYACEGRGDDLQGYAHDWAGEADGVLACLESLARRVGTLRWLAGPIDEEPAARLRAAGAPRVRQSFARARIPNLPKLFREISAGSSALESIRLEEIGSGVRFTGASGTVELSELETFTLLLGPERPEKIARALSGPQYLALRSHFPWPFYLWGLDSI